MTNKTDEMRQAYKNTCSPNRFNGCNDQWWFEAGYQAALASTPSGQPVTSYSVTASKCPDCTQFITAAETHYCSGNKLDPSGQQVDVALRFTVEEHFNTFIVYDNKCGEPYQKWENRASAQEHADELNADALPATPIRSGECEGYCTEQKPYGFVPQAGCPVHDRSGEVDEDEAVDVVLLGLYNKQCERIGAKPEKRVRQSIRELCVITFEDAQEAVRALSKHYEIKKRN